MPLLRSSPSDYTSVVKSLAVAGAAVSNPQGSRPASKGAVAFVNVASTGALIRGSPRLVTTPAPKAAVVPAGPVDPNYTVYQATRLFGNNYTNWYGMLELDTSGNLYYRDASDFKFYKITPGGTRTFVAGNGINNSTFSPGLGAAAQFANQTRSMVLDSLNNIFVCNSQDNDHRIIKIEPNGNVTSFAGTGTSGYTDGPAASATFDSPIGMAIDASNTLYVSEYFRKTIRKITSGGQVSTLTFTAAFNTSFYSLAVDSTGILYGLDPALNRVYKITPTGPSTADITLLAGSTAGYANGQGSAAQFNVGYDAGLCVDRFGNIYVGDGNNGSVRKITPGGLVSTIFGNGTNGASNTSTQLQTPGRPKIDSNDVIYVPTPNNFQKLTPVS